VLLRAASGGASSGGAALRLGGRGEGVLLQRDGLLDTPAEELSRKELIDRVKVLQSIQAGSAVATGEAEVGGDAKRAGNLSITNISDCGRKCLVVLNPEAYLNHSIGMCASDEENCLSNRCCVGPGLQCYAKNKTHGRCKPDCVPGPDLKDEEFGIWNCSRIGVRSPGQPVRCSEPGKNCAHTRCCEAPGATCFAKNASFASCKATCSPDEPDQSDEDPGLWSCKALGKKAKGAAAWVQRRCSKGYQECSATRCCSEPGMQCFEKDKYWAQCLPNCTAAHGAGPGWACKALGDVSPEKEKKAEAAGPPGGKVAKWVEDTCSAGFEDCSSSRCCKQPGYQCYMKNEFFGMCKENCTRGLDAYDNDTWSCEKAGPRSWGLATKGWPSLYCWALVRVKGYEAVIIRMQAEAYVGIFGCDGHAIVADGAMKRIDQTVNLQMTRSDQDIVGVSSDGTAANTLLFIEAWRAVVRRGDYDFHDWTLKVDPDTVMLPDRVRTHLLPHTSRREGLQYVLNCNCYPERADFPMMYGALEVLSRKAVKRYAWGHNNSCVNKFHWQQWGEDVFMVSCMNALGVGKVNDFKIIGDNKCIGHGHGGANCNDGQLAAFHPFKDIRSWTRCFQAATGYLLKVTQHDEVAQWS
jgi:hypothetical protein